MPQWVPEAARSGFLQVPAEDADRGGRAAQAVGAASGKAGRGTNL
jgi:hypothetical protein